MNKRELLELLQKEAQGNCTPEETARLDAWYASFDRQDTPVFSNETEAELVRARLRARIYRQITADMPDLPAPAPQRKIGMFLRVAAVVLVLLGLAGAAYFFRQERTALPQPIALLSSASPAGKMLKVTLTDGSEVWLNAGSSLSYPAAFNGPCRAVYLKGEAFFEVATRPQQPFVVHTDTISTVVLGTSFNIKAYPELGNIRINVATGKVGIVRGGNTLATLSQDQQLTYSKPDHTWLTETKEAGPINAWKEGRINLDGVSFDELAAVLEHNFGYRLQTSRTDIRKVRFSMNIITSHKIDDVMRIVCGMTQTRYRVRERIITIY
ncbi:ferric-dicitrate binding protein FerR, regulates iron transport through sigma-19 [Chitinophaga eiseniae]|uniref:Ferric-dicitrate binding protein FerR, regulates iron transport through sigma-19 n=1 Tax=Chitinophaga eiseniae TaxID=634771 RepID=A0A1T4NAE1_9BACT|nr:FecR family protein [Chitinophaga eiseniae]SJZ76212.1 ferric-dicitrate binding protein FerR, regulates iron transport through sigma-19 [Chitinophaga eiseniae]